MSIENIVEVTFRAGLPFTADGKPYEIPDGEHYIVPSETMKLLVEAREDNPDILEFEMSDELKEKFPYKVTMAERDYYQSGKMVLIDGKILNLRYQTLAMDLEQAEEEDRP